MSFTKSIHSSWTPRNACQLCIKWRHSRFLWNIAVIIWDLWMFILPNDLWIDSSSWHGSVHAWKDIWDGYRIYLLVWYSPAWVIGCASQFVGGFVLLFSPPVRWGLLDFMSACPPPPSSFLRSSPTSTASSRSQCSPPDPYSNLWMRAVPAEPQPQRISEDIPGRMPERMSEDMPDTYARNNVR